VAFCSLGVVVAGGHTVTAYGAPAAVPSRWHAERQSIGDQQSCVASAGTALAHLMLQTTVVAEDAAVSRLRRAGTCGKLPGRR
jgi:hypothetical protein